MYAAVVYVGSTRAVTLNVYGTMRTDGYVWEGMCMRMYGMVRISTHYASCRATVA